jgi:hypothetical protein
VRFTEFAADREQTMQARNPDVIKPRDTRTKGFGGDRGFFGDPQIAGSGAEHSNVAAGLHRRRLTQGEDLRRSVVRSLRVRCEHKLCRRFIHVRRQDIDARRNEAGKDGSCLFRRLAARIYDLRQTRAKTPMVIDARVAEIFKGKRGEALCGIVRR